MKRMLVCFFTLATIIFTGCGDDNGSGSKSGGNSNTNQPPATPTNTLAGHTLQFTVTQSQNFSEPEGAVYLISYTEAEYTFYPSTMNRETTQQEMGTYTYSPETGMIHYSRPDHQDIDGLFHFDTPTSGTVHMAGPEGETEDANFVVTN